MWWGAAVPLQRALLGSRHLPERKGIPGSHWGVGVSPEEGEGTPLY